MADRFYREKAAGSNVQRLEDANSKPEQKVIDALEEALAMAKSGEMRSVVITGDLIGNEWYSNAKFIDGLVLLGHLDIAKQAVRRGMTHDCGEAP